MRTHVALLRGINVGGHDRLPMADLRGIVTALGFDDVTTNIQSGNVGFGTSETDTAALRSVVSDNPFPHEEDPKRLHVIFHREPISPGAVAAVVEAERMARIRGSRDEAAVVGSSLYLRTPDGLGRSVLADLLARPGGGADRAVVNTMRNWATVTVLVGLLDA